MLEYVMEEAVMVYTGLERIQQTTQSCGKTTFQVL